MPKRVFISWSGGQGRELAEALSEVVIKAPQRLKSYIKPQNLLEGWVSSRNIGAGNEWFEEITRAATDAQFAIAILTGGSSKRPWVNFEAGFLYQKLKNFKPLKMCASAEIGGPLAQLQVVDGTKKQGVVQLLEGMVPGNADDWAELVFDEWQSRFMAIMEKTESPADRLSSCADHLVRITDKFSSDDNSFTSNSCFQEVVLGSIRSLASQFAQTRPKHFSAPATEYPQYLIGVQRSLHVDVQAIALVDQRERFWQLDIGREILATTSGQSRRVFVFVTAEDLIRNVDFIGAHARAYEAGIISYEVLAREFQHYAKDFSILSSGGCKLLALYGDHDGQKTITFSADHNEIADHEEAFKAVWRRSRKVEYNAGLNPEAIASEVFDVPRLTVYQKKDVEMSAYISIEEYDEHEEEHAYFLEMMELMLSKLTTWESAGDRPTRVLELGAGTGIFTKRLAAAKNVQIDAVEVDWACFRRLRYNLSHAVNVRLHNRDSRVFDPAGNYDFVFSSFADHHIPPRDKPVYLENIKRNMAKAGHFVVGDEFLGDHNYENKEERARALRMYHEHILDIAQQKGNNVLEKLEREALDSGLNELGDFKLSRRQFERFLTNAGFNFSAEKIGPMGRDQIDGVYVYDISLPTS